VSSFDGGRTETSRIWRTGHVTSNSRIVARSGRQPFCGMARLAGTPVVYREMPFTAVNCGYDGVGLSALGHRPVRVPQAPLPATDALTLIQR
jgi:hypothetical protein